MKKIIMNKETKLAIYQALKNDLINILDEIETLISEDYTYIKKDISDIKKQSQIFYFVQSRLKKTLL